MIVPVTLDLANAMNRTSLVLGTVSRNTKKMNDRAAYPELAKQLEDLTVNILTASSLLSLIGVQPAGARFDFSPDMNLSATVNQCVSYLRNDATNLLKDVDILSPYESTHVDNVLDRIKSLYGLLTAAIVMQVRVDVAAISNLSPSRLVAVAAHVAGAVEPEGLSAKLKARDHLS